jgi:hypothetical protein
MHTSNSTKFIALHQERRNGHVNERTAAIQQRKQLALKRREQKPLEFGEQQVRHGPERVALVG